MSDINAALTRLVSFGLEVDSSTTVGGLPLALKIENDDSKNIGSYNLAVTASGIKITGVDANGFIMACSLLQV